MHDELLTLADRMIQGSTHDDRSHRAEVVRLLRRRASEAAIAEDRDSATNRADRLEASRIPASRPSGLSTF